MIINVYNYFSEIKSKKKDYQKVILYKHVAEVLDIKESTIVRIVLNWRSHGDNTFIPYKILKHFKSQLDENILELLYTKILNANIEKGYNFFK